MQIGKDYIGVGVGAFIVNDNMNYCYKKEQYQQKKIIGVYRVVD